MPRKVKSILIEGCCLLERFFIVRYIGKTLVDGLILNNARWVLGFGVYIEWNVSWFRKGLCVPFFKYRVMSRSFAVCLFTLIAHSQTVFADDGTKLLCTDQNHTHHGTPLLSGTADMRQQV